MGLTIGPEQQKDFDWRGIATYARKHLPQSSVLIFVRLVDGEIGGAASHNNKQDNVALRSEGVERSQKGSKVPGGKNDQVYWITPESDRYIIFEDEDWSSLTGGTARL